MWSSTQQAERQRTAPSKQVGAGRLRTKMMGLILPAIIWKVLPASWNLWMGMFFLLSQMLPYFFMHVHGINFLTSLLSVHWIKQVIIQWETNQVKDFLRNTLYLLLTVSVSLMVTTYIWQPIRNTCITTIQDVFGAPATHLQVIFQEIPFFLIALFLFCGAVMRLEIWHSLTQHGARGPYSKVVSRSKLVNPCQRLCLVVSHAKRRLRRMFENAKLQVSRLWLRPRQPVVMWPREDVNTSAVGRQDRDDQLTGLQTLDTSNFVMTPPPTASSQHQAGSLLSSNSGTSLADSQPPSPRQLPNASSTVHQRMSADRLIASTSTRGCLTSPVTRSHQRTFLLEERGGLRAHFLRECQHPLHQCGPCQCC